MYNKRCNSLVAYFQINKWEATQIWLKGQCEVRLRSVSRYVGSCQRLEGGCECGGCVEPTNPRRSYAGKLRFLTRCARPRGVVITCISSSEKGMR